MSHTTTIKSVRITSATALAAAVAELKAAGVNCELKHNVKPRMFYADQHGVCDHVLSLPGIKYDVGFEKQNDGSYAPVFDEWAGAVGSQIGATCPMPGSREERAQHAIGRLMQGYAKHAAIEAAVMQGYTVEGTTTDAQGNVHLTLTGM